MTHHNPFPADAPVHSLDHWLSPELARVSPPNAPSRLRQLADAQGTRAAGWSSAIAGGPVLALAGMFFAVTSGNPAAALVLVPLGAVLMLSGLYGWKRARAALPATDKAVISRGPGSARGGVAMVSVLAVALGAIMVLYLPSATAKGNGAQQHSWEPSYSSCFSWSHASRSRQQSWAAPGSRSGNGSNPTPSYAGQLTKTWPSGAILMAMPPTDRSDNRSAGL